LKEREIEDFVRKKLSVEVEERCLAHLLWCGDCQDKVVEEAEFAAATRQALARLERDVPGYETARSGFGWGRQLAQLWQALPVPRRWGWAAVPVCLTLGAALLVPPQNYSTGTYSEAVLRSERGSVTTATVDGAAGAHLRLRIDLSDVPVLAGYRVTIVDATGRTVESRAVRAEAGAITLEAQRQLTPERYWVRLSAQDGHLLREYALRVR
jgi:hypothetical protein